MIFKMDDRAAFKTLLLDGLLEEVSLYEGKDCFGSQCWMAQFMVNGPLMSHL